MINLESYRQSFIKGDKSPLKEWYIEYHDDIIRVIRSKKICSFGEEEDYLNEAMIQLHEKIMEGKITELISVKNYLIGICINLNKRSYDSKLRLEKKVEEVRLHLYNNYDYKVEDAHRRDMILKVREHLSNLSERCQSIIIAYYIDGLTMKEISKYLSLSSGDVAKTLKSRCFKKLLNKVKPQKV